MYIQNVSFFFWNSIWKKPVLYTGELGYDRLNGTRKIGPSYAKSVVYIWRIFDLHRTGTKHIVCHMQKSVVQWSVISKFTCIQIIFVFFSIILAYPSSPVYKSSSFFFPIILVICISYMCSCTMLEKYKHSKVQLRWICKKFKPCIFFFAWEKSNSKSYNYTN